MPQTLRESYASPWNAWTLVEAQSGRVRVISSFQEVTSRTENTHFSELHGRQSLVTFVKSQQERTPNTNSSHLVPGYFAPGIAVGRLVSNQASLKSFPRSVRLAASRLGVESWWAHELRADARSVPSRVALSPTANVRRQRPDQAKDRKRGGCSVKCR